MFIIRFYPEDDALSVYTTYVDCFAGFFIFELISDSVHDAETAIQNQFVYPRLHFVFRADQVMRWVILPNLDLALLWRVCSRYSALGLAFVPSFILASHACH